MGQESEIEKSVSKYARGRGCYVRKFSSPGNRGVPDRLFLSPHGRAFFIEFKAPGKKPTALQLREIGLIEACGVGACHVDSVAQGKAFVDQQLKT